MRPEEALHWAPAEPPFIAVAKVHAGVLNLRYVIMQVGGDKYSQAMYVARVRSHGSWFELGYPRRRLDLEKAKAWAQENYNSRRNVLTRRVRHDLLPELEELYNVHEEKVGDDRARRKSNSTVG